MAESAGFTWKQLGDPSLHEVATMTAYVAASRAMPADVLPMVAAVAEKLAAAEVNHELVADFVENIQNATSHGLPQLHDQDSVLGLLGPRCRKYWDAADTFWTAVAEWRVGTGEPLQASADLFQIENEQLRATMWTSARSLGDGTRVGLADAVRFEKAGGEPIPGYRELMAQ